MPGLNLTNYAERKMLDHLTGVASWPTATRYLGFSAAYPASEEDRENGAGLAEPTGGGYVRKPLSGLEPVAESASIIPYAYTWKSTFIEFPTQTADWGLHATGTGGSYNTGLIWDAPTAGNLLAWFPTYNITEPDGGVGYFIRIGGTPLRFHLDRDNPTLAGTNTLQFFALSATYRAHVLRHLLGMASLLPPDWWLNPWVDFAGTIDPANDTVDVVAGTTRQQVTWGAAVTALTTATPYRGTYARNSAELVFPCPYVAPSLGYNYDSGWAAWNATGGGTLIGISGNPSGAERLVAPGFNLYLRANTLYLKAY